MAKVTKMAKLAWMDKMAKTAKMPERRIGKKDRMTKIAK